MKIHMSRVRTVGAACALAAMAVFGIAACSDDSSPAADTASATASASDAQPAPSTAADSSTSGAHHDAGTLSAPDAQRILRTIVDPKTPPQERAKLVDEDDDNIATTLQNFAQNASRGGYTPEVFTVTSVQKVDDDEANAKVSVKSPHAPAPVELDYKFTHEDGAWKLSDDATKNLLKMSQR